MHLRILIILAALECFAAAATAETIQLKAGEIPLQTFSGGNTYIGHPSGTTVKSIAGKPSLVVGNAVVLKNIKFTGDGVRRDNSLSDLTVENCDFEGCRVGVEVNGGRGVTITRSGFTKCNWSSWIGNVSDLLIENNDLSDVGYGFKVFGDAAANRNWKVRRNHIRNSGPDVMAIEIQGQCINWSVEENLVEQWRFGPNRSDNDHSLIISAPMAKALGPGSVVRNAVLAKKPRSATGDGPWQDGAPAALEIGGTNTVVEQNLLSGAGVGITCTDKDGPATVTLRNNRVVDVFNVWNKDAGSQVVTLQGFNGAGVLDWTIDDLRAKVGRRSVSVPPATQPAPVPTSKPSVTITVESAGDVDINVIRK